MWHSFAGDSVKYFFIYWHRPPLPPYSAQSPALKRTGTNWIFTPQLFFNYTQTFLNKKRRHSSTLPTALSPRCPLLMLSTHSSCCPLSSWPPSRCPQLLPLSSTPPAVLDSSRCPHVVHSSRSTPPVVLWQSLINTFSSLIMSRRHLQYLPP